MARSRKYTMLHVNRVAELINNHGMTRRQAIKHAGYTDASLFYKQLRDSGIRETVTFEKVGPVKPEKPKHSFI